MPRKLKAEATTSAKEVIMTLNDAPARPDPIRRRSNRRTTLDSSVKEIPSRNGQLKEEESSDPSSTSTPGKMNENEDEVNDAIKGLAKMEKKLRRATKRQKLEIEESNVDIRGDMKEQEPFKPRMGPDARAKPKRKVTNTLPTSDAEPVESMGSPGDQDFDDENGEFQENEGLADTFVVAERGAARPPAVNTSYLPLPWTGRLGYACLNTYLRCSKPPVFSSRTCRMASIIDHRFPLQDPSQPEHVTKNRPDKTQKSDVARGQKFVQDLGVANAKDVVKMIRWNDKYGIRFMRLSSEMFPFASHPEHGYTLAPFASEVLADAGKVIAELNHRVTTHPGQFTQLGSPRPEVIKGSVRDLIYHDEMLSLLKLPPQQDRDAVMILHMGGIFGDKAATVARFRENYTKLLSPSIKARLVLENDDVGWSVHDLLPVCEELNIPMVLDYHHHNIVFDADQIREGTFDISQAEITQRIAATWARKNITQKMHYSEPRPEAVTPRDRRKHSPRVSTLPPCPPGVDLMIEAKDKEQAVFELMRNFRLPGFERFNDVIPHEREDEDKPAPKTPKKKAAGKKRKKADDEAAEDEEADVKLEAVPQATIVSSEDFGMGGPLNRVYWPQGMEDWLKPKKREINKKPQPAKEAEEE